MWKLLKVSVTQILREIKVGESKVSKSAKSTHLEALNFDFYEFLHRLKFSQSKCKNGSFRTFKRIPTLISRKNMRDRKILKFPQRM